MQLAEGAVIRLPDGDREWQVSALLGEGGQGAVYRIEAVDGQERPRALKWYAPHSATPAQREALERLVGWGAPSSDYLWPEQLVDGSDGTFGYTMGLRPAEYCGFGEVLTGRIAAPLSVRLQIAANLAHAYLELHMLGLCYRDISFGNVFVHPVRGDVLICDNDNVGVDGTSVSAVLGTRRFMAPEVIRREVMPSMGTDLHSLAVLIFYLLMFHHPLIGTREFELRGRDGETVLLGTDPVFLFDPDDSRNRPHPAHQPGPALRWQHCPPRLRELFLKTFGPGLHDPARRVRESIWRAQLDQAIDDIVVCARCGQDQMSEGGIRRTCAFCRADIDEIVVLADHSRRLVLNEGTEITAHHVHRDYDRATVWGRVVYDPVRGMWGLENTSAQTWGLRLPDRRAHTVDPGRRAALIDGAEFTMGPRLFRVEVIR